MLGMLSMLLVGCITNTQPTPNCKSKKCPTLRPTLSEVEGQEVLIAAFADREMVARRVDEIAGTEADGPVIVPDHFGHPVGRIRPAMKVVQIEQV